MIRCPNCGSIAQMVYMFCDHPTSAHTIEHWRCGCGCTVRRTLKETNRMVEYPNGEIKTEESIR